MLDDDTGPDNYLTAGRVKTWVFNRASNKVTKIKKNKQREKKNLWDCSKRNL